MPGEWIPVNKRLPRPGIPVLIFALSGYIKVRYFVPDDGKHCWGWYPGGLPISSTSHWMELPSPPEGESHAG